MRVQAASKFAFGGAADFMGTESTPDRSNGFLSLPSLAPNYQRTSTFAEFDTRRSPGFTRTGGLLRAQFADYRQVNGDGYGFQRVDAEMHRYVPLFGENQGLAFRATAASTFTGTGATVPFYLLPNLGGHDALRGYSSWRFRDRNRLLLSSEYRWAAGPLVDMSLFLDAGAVAPRFQDLADQTLRTSYGVGFTVHTPKVTMLRIEGARSREGLGLLISFGPSF